LGGGQDLELGFSIKSQLGQASTLLNSSGVTNLEYTLVGGNLDELEIRGKKYHETRQLLRERNIRLQYTGTKSSTFLDNLEFFGADFPSKLGALVESAFMESSTSPLLTENVDLWAANHGGQLAGLKLRYQLKSLLRAVALGMKPGSAWVGDLEGYGGFIVVREDGELVCLHLENDDDFKTYLLNNSRFDFPKDELFAKPFMRDGKLIFSINFQVRFVK
jgi:type II restriction enzyme